MFGNNEFAFREQAGTCLACNPVAASLKPSMDVANRRPMEKFAQQVLFRFGGAHGSNETCLLRQEETTFLEFLFGPKSPWVSLITNQRGTAAFFRNGLYHVELFSTRQVSFLTFSSLQIVYMLAIPALAPCTSATGRCWKPIFSVF